MQLPHSQGLFLFHKYQNSTPYVDIPYISFSIMKYQKSIKEGHIRTLLSYASTC